MSNIFPDSRTQAACMFSIESLPVEKNRKGESIRYLWTLTCPDVVDFREFSRRWLIFLKRFKRLFPDVSGVRVFEMHPGKDDLGHGWHGHFVVGVRLDVRILREWWDDINGASARIHVVEIPLDQCDYVAKYLGKQHREEWMRGYRLWGKWGPFEGTRVKDIGVRSAFTRAFAYCKEVGGAVGAAFARASFTGKCCIVNWLVREDLCYAGRKYGFLDPYEKAGFWDPASHLDSWRLEKSVVSPLGFAVAI